MPTYRIGCSIHADEYTVDVQEYVEMPVRRKNRLSSMSLSRAFHIYAMCSVVRDDYNSSILHQLH